MAVLLEGSCSFRYEGWHRPSPLRNLERGDYSNVSDTLT